VRSNPFAFDGPAAQMKRISTPERIQMGVQQEQATLDTHQSILIIDAERIQK